MPPQRRVLAFEQLRQERNRDMTINVHVEHNIGKETLAALKELITVLNKDKVDTDKLQAASDASDKLEEKARKLQEELNKPTKGTED